MYTIDYINLLYMIYKGIIYKGMIKCEDTVIFGPNVIELSEFADFLCQFILNKF